MGCLHSKNKKEIDDLDSVKNDAPAKPPPDYSKIETPEILKLREKLKELDVAGQDEEVVLKQLFSHLDSLYPRISTPTDSSPVTTLENNSTSFDETRWKGGVGFGDAQMETQEIAERKALLLQKEKNLTRIYQLLQKHLPMPSSESDLSRKYLELARSSNFLYVSRGLLYNDSILDLSLHSALYTALLNLLEAIFVNKVSRALLLDQIEKSSESVQSVFEKMHQTAATYLYLATNVQGEGDPVANELANLIVQVWSTMRNPSAVPALFSSPPAQPPAPAPAPSIISSSPSVNPESQAKEKNQQQPAATTTYASRLRNAQSRRLNRTSTFEALARGVSVSAVSPATSPRVVEEEQKETNIEKEKEPLKEKQPLVETLPASSPSDAAPPSSSPKNIAVVELKPQTKETPSPASTPLLKNWKLGTARDLPAPMPNAYPDFISAAVSPADTILEYDAYGNPVRAVIAAADRKPHPLLVPFMNKDASVPIISQTDPKYCDALRDHLFGNAPIDVTKHHFKHMFEQTMSKTKMSRLLSELGSLARSLPLTEGSSVFLRCAEKGIDVMKALIVGPQGTPYQNGCFVFDIYLPSQYPSVPPVVHLCTTGGGSVRFNPNLYAEGKVCLSLLGTWSGEPWGPTSTLLQVLVSIQSLILVSNPYFNEPGWESYQGTPEGTKASKNYSDNLLGETITWAMYQHLIAPDDAFGDVIATHLYLKRHEIRKQLIQWHEKTDYPSLLTTPISKLIIELEKLEKNPPKLVTGA